MVRGRLLTWRHAVGGRLYDLVLSSPFGADQRNCRFQVASNVVSGATGIGFRLSGWQVLGSAASLHAGALAGGKLRLALATDGASVGRRL